MLWEGSDYNWSEWKINSNQDAHSINADPLFNNIDEKDFTLQFHSPAINAGINVGLDYDFKGVPLPKELLWI
jgi:hypothetical protein